VKLLEEEKIAQFINDRITPFAELDGGRVELVHVEQEKSRIVVRFAGSYKGAPCREIIHKYVVEPALKREFSDLVDVTWID
jgi:Fe-S cluster biogenesis protein NfuA